MRLIQSDKNIMKFLFNHPQHSTYWMLFTGSFPLDLRNQHTEPINLDFCYFLFRVSVEFERSARRPSEIYSVKLRGVEEKFLAC